MSHFRTRDLEPYPDMDHVLRRGQLNRNTIWQAVNVSTCQPLERRARYLLQIFPLVCMLVVEKWHRAPFHES